jgi:hypothetical protein
VHFRDQRGVENLLEQSAGPARNNGAIGYNVPVLERSRAEQVNKYRNNDNIVESSLYRHSIDEQHGPQNTTTQR